MPRIFSAVQTGWRRERDSDPQYNFAAIVSFLVSTKSARFGLSLGGIGGSLVRKLVKHTKVLGSWPANERGIH
jgi:hypothetical protein